MTPEEKKALLQFMGMTYGHSHKLDTHIVGTSQFVKPISTTVKEAFEHVLKSDTVASPVPTHNQQPIIQETKNNPQEISSVSKQHNISQPLPVINNTPVNQLDIIAQQLTRIGNILETLTKDTNARARKKAKD